MINKKKYPILYNKKQIQEAVKKIGKKITKDYNKINITDIVAICIMNSATVFFSDLIRNIDLKIKTYFINPFDSESSFPPIDNEHVLIIEDIADSGSTLHRLIEDTYVIQKSLSLRTVVLLNRISNKIYDIKIDYNCFKVRNKKFFIGYGLDYKEWYRNLPNIHYIPYIKHNPLRRENEKISKNQC